MERISFILRKAYRNFASMISYKIFFGRHIGTVPEGSIVFFGISESTLFCGIAGVVAIKKKVAPVARIDMDVLDQMVSTIETHDFASCKKSKMSLENRYLGGREYIDNVLKFVSRLKQDNFFIRIFQEGKIQASLQEFSNRLANIFRTEEKAVQTQRGHLLGQEEAHVDASIEILKDIHWCIEYEILQNVQKIKALIKDSSVSAAPRVISLFKNINTVLNSIDRLEVRGRDSSGISIMFFLPQNADDLLKRRLEEENLLESFRKRSTADLLRNRSIHVLEPVNDMEIPQTVMISFTYKIAAEIGSLGDNVKFLREQIKYDPIFHHTAECNHLYHTVFSHTRWASVGAITEANCCPIDNHTIQEGRSSKGWIYVCLNGDIDNYLELKNEFENNGGKVHQDITTDTKIIPIQIEKYCQQGYAIEDAFRLSANDFKGSHAIAMHTSLAPGKLFLAQKGSGQALFVGLESGSYVATSEVYGFVEETPAYIKLDRSLGRQADAPNNQGKILILHQQSRGGLDGISAMNYDGSIIKLNESDIKHTRITSRDIDRRGYPHYFLKEITEAPDSVEKTLQGRWRIDESDTLRYTIHLDQHVMPQKLRRALADSKIRRIFFIGQGTAGVAASACASILKHYLNDPRIHIDALKASEFSGFYLDQEMTDSMADTVVIAVSQSGTTTDTNRTIDMVRARGAHTVAIVNRRDSDITFKVDGVMYTSSGRDIEMSVASTKAFYSQIVAGALFGLYIARFTGMRDDGFVSMELRKLLELPGHMRRILDQRTRIEVSAKRLALKRIYWAVVGSGANKASADEIRIKLSELCYKTISTDYVEDKKHIDLSSEPLIIVCAAGTRDTVIGDIIKDTAIFKAHKAIPLVIADDGEHRFDPYAEDVFHVPVVSEYLAPIVNTLVGHIWGYYAALAIHAKSHLLFRFRQEIQQMLEQFAQSGLDIYEVVLEKSFREKITGFYQVFRSPKTSTADSASYAMDFDLMLLLKYLSGRLPVSDFELDFSVKGTAQNMMNKLFECLSESINRMSRPIDAIKHQAKTVTVGTSRISDKIEGMLFDELLSYGYTVSQLTPSNTIVLRNLQEIISGINGSILYRVNDLNLLGEPTEKTTITVVLKKGILVSIPSRVETDPLLKGTKHIIVKEGNVFMGQGRKDGRNIIIIPVMSNEPVVSNRTEYLLLLNISFKTDVTLMMKIRALGGKYDRVKNIVLESGLAWEDEYLESMEMEILFGKSAEKIAEHISMNVVQPSKLELVGRGK